MTETTPPEDPFMPKDLHELTDRLWKMLDGERIIREQGVNTNPAHYGKLALVNIRTEEITLCENAAVVAFHRRGFGLNPSYVKLITGY